MDKSSSFINAVGVQTVQITLLYSCYRREGVISIFSGCSYNIYGTETLDFWATH